MRLVCEGTGETRLQIKFGLVLCSGGCWSTCVAGENKRSFGIQGEKEIVLLSLYISRQIQIFHELKRYLEFLWQRKL